MLLTGINHLAFITNDMDKTIRFYRDLLGMELVAGIGHHGYRHYFFQFGDNQVALFQTRGDMETKGGVELNHMALRMDPESYEAVKARLEGAGVNVHGRTGDPTCIYFDDPDGHGLQLLYKGHD